MEIGRCPSHCTYPTGQRGIISMMQWEQAGSVIVSWTDLNGAKAGLR